MLLVLPITCVHLASTALLHYYFILTIYDKFNQDYFLVVFPKIGGFDHHIETYPLF